MHRLALALAFGLPATLGAQLPFEPTLELVETDPDDRSAILQGSLPAGFRHIVLEESPDLGSTWLPMVSGPLTGAAATVTFRCPAGENRSFYRIRMGEDPEIPPAAGSGPELLSVVYGDAGEFIPPLDETIHVLNRLAYGPSPGDFARVTSTGAPAYVEEQLDPASLGDDAQEAVIRNAMDTLMLDPVPGSGTPLVPLQSSARYFKGTSEPPADWASRTFDSSSWLQGSTGIGYGDGDDRTVLTDMQGNYLSVYLRQEFDVADPGAFAHLGLHITYDDGFVAYLNGTEIARREMTGSPPPFDTPANRSRFSTIFIDVTRSKNLLVPGTNVLAVQAHNSSLGSDDFSISPWLEALDPAVADTIASVNNLKHLLHLRGIHSRRQLQCVLAEFWENHFTTDYDKVRDFINAYRPYRIGRDRSFEENRRLRTQANFEAATIELREYEFFYENALGYFGDLLLYSATSPAMLIYLDSVENTAEAPNENYAREILELSSFGVDNRYTQEDIVELARCFTGWNVRKIRPSEAPPFPQSALDPPTTGDQTVSTSLEVVGQGADWSYFKGTQEPPTGWMLPGFDDAGWLQGPSGIGYETNQNDTAVLAMIGTTLTDMRRTSSNPTGYSSLYMRKTLTLPDVSGTGEVVAATVRYDDGYILYLNGSELIRTPTMPRVNDALFPPFDATARFGHEATGSPDTIPLSSHPAYVPGGENTIALQGLNQSFTSGDFVLLPEVVRLTYTADSVEPTAPEGVWTFRFKPGDHDTGSKVLFPGTEFQIDLPAGRTGPEGVRDALDVIDALVGHPSTAEFISIKLVNRFVSDDISLVSYKERSAPDHLLGLVDQCVQAWGSTDPPGHIPTVLRTIFDPAFKASPFWSEGAFLTKGKTPLEFLNSAVRALDGSVLRDNRLRIVNDRMGMTFFTRDDPDGFSELGVDWIDTLGFLERMRHAQLLGADSGSSYSDWDLNGFNADPNLQTISQILDHFDTLVFNGTLGAERRQVLTAFANTRYFESGGEVVSEDDPFDDLIGSARRNRLADVIGLLLSTPEFYLQ